MNSRDLKILFVNPCLRKGAEVKILPIGLGYVMTLVAAHGYRFDFFDVDLNEYDDVYIEKYVKDNKYDVILFGSIVTHYKWIKWLAKTIKAHHPETVVVVGNSVGGSCYDVFMRNAPADVTVIGEGEYAALDVLNAVRDGGDFSKIAGIAYRDASGQIIKNPPRPACDINQIPLVNWDFFEVDRYISGFQKNISFGVDQSKKKTITMPVSTARGCVFKCTFCHYVFWDDPYRHRHADQVMTEIRRNMDRYGANYINFWDDLSFSSLPQIEKMADAIIASGLKFDWMGAVRTDLFGNAKIPYDRRVAVAEKVKKSGCAALGFSLESANPDIIKMMNKKIQPEYFAEHIKILRSVGITCNTSVVFGYPIETPETIQQTFNMCYENRIYPSIGFLLPLPYTGMYAYAKENGFITDEDAYLTSITERQDICLNMTKMSDDQIMGEIKHGAKRLNDLLNLHLNEDSYVRTGGYKKHTNLKKPPLDPDNIKRNENDFSFNYSDTTFEVDQGKC